MSLVISFNMSSESTSIPRVVIGRIVHAVDLLVVVYGTSKVAVLPSRCTFTLSLNRYLRHRMQLAN